MTEQTQRYRIGVIGCGTIGSQHAGVLTGMRSARLAAVADLDTARARVVAERAGAAVYEDYERMLAEQALDGVVVATPDPEHRAPAVASAEAGCGVLVEKPIATDERDADAIVDACHRSGVPLLVGFVLRHFASYVKLKQAVDAGTVGRMVSLFARRQNIQANGERLAAVTDPLTFLGIHDIDFIQWLHPARIHTVHAQATQGALAMRTGKPECVFTTLAFDGGALAVIESGWSLPDGWGAWSTPSGWRPRSSFRLDVNGDTGYLTLDLTAPLVAGVDGREGWKFPEVNAWPEVNGKVSGALALQMDHFVDCLAGDATPIADGESARRATRILRAAHRSLETRTPVSVDL